LTDSVEFLRFIDKIHLIDRLISKRESFAATASSIRAHAQTRLSSRRLVADRSRRSPGEAKQACTSSRRVVAIVFQKYFCKSNRNPMCHHRNGFTGDLVLTVHSLDRAFQITRRTITRTVRAASGTRSSGASHSRTQGRRMRMTRIRARSSTRASFLPSSFELAGIVIEYARNVAAEYAISQMIRENSDRLVRFYASASRCTAPSRQENEEREMTIGDADRKCSIDVLSILKRSRA